MKNSNKPVIVEQENGLWIVRNYGDSAILFQSEVKDFAVDFAKDMAEQHGISLKVIDPNAEEENIEEVKGHNLIVTESEGKWIVCHEGDTAVLFSAPLKDQALTFAKQMAEEHGLKVIVKTD